MLVSRYQVLHIVNSKRGEQMNQVRPHDSNDNREHNNTLVLMDINQKIKLGSELQKWYACTC